MGDNSDHLTPPTSYIAATPSGLTPNTRTEAEAALTANSMSQTDSAAPTTPFPTSDFASASSRGYGYSSADSGLAFRTGGPPHEESIGEAARSGSIGEHPREDSIGGGPAQDVSFRRPGSLVRTSSTNYAEALAASSLTKSPTSASPIDTKSPPPDLSNGVVPRSPTSGIGSGQAEALKRVRPTGLSLGALGRQPSWNEQDMKHVYQSRLMSTRGEDQGYSSAVEEEK